MGGSSRPRYNGKIISRTSDTSSFQSDAFDIRGARNISLQAVWAETSITGASIAVEVSDSYGEEGSSATWDEVTSTSQTISSDSSFTWDLNLNSGWVRLSVVIGGGTLDSLDVYMTQKGD